MNTKDTKDTKLIGFRESLFVSSASFVFAAQR